jgi:hypothetical protein
LQSCSGDQCAEKRFLFCCHHKIPGKSKRFIEIWRQEVYIGVL